MAKTGKPQGKANRSADLPDSPRDEKELKNEQTTIDLPDVKLKSRTRFAETQALTDGNGVLVRWTMATEEKNAGFYVYRVDDTEHPLNSSMIIGSMGTTGSKAVAGTQYQYFDPNGSLASVYVVRGVGADGRSVMSDQIASPLHLKDCQA